MPTTRDYYYAPGLRLITMYTHYENRVACGDADHTRRTMITNRDPGDENGEGTPDVPPKGDNPFLSEEARQRLMDGLTETAPLSVPIVRETDRQITIDDRPMDPLPTPTPATTNWMTTWAGAIIAVLVAIRDYTANGGEFSWFGIAGAAAIALFGYLTRDRKKTTPAA